MTLIITIVSNSFSQPDNWQLIHSGTEQRLKSIVAAQKGIMGIAAVDLTSGERFGVNEHLVFPQGSAIKIPILMEIYKQAEAGKIRLTDRLPVRQASMVGGSGILQQFSDNGSQLSVYDLGVLMIVLSDNTATNMLIDLAGMEDVNSTLTAVGLKQTKLQRKMIDTDASARGQENLSTPAEALRIMEMLHRGEFISRKVCDDILDVLRKAKSGDIRAGIPASVPVAFKPGGIAGVSTVWAIVHLEGRPYAVTVMENFELDNEAAQATREVSRVLYEHFWRLSKSTKYGTYRQ
jgi:beta-lactamase class A